MSTSNASPSPSLSLSLGPASAGPLPGGGSSAEGVTYQSGDIAWMMIVVVLVMLMIPGVGLLYAGLVRKKSALSMLWLCGMATATAFLQWLLWGYSLTFSPTAGRYLGDLHHVGFRHVVGRPSVVDKAVPDLLFALYHGVVAAITVVIAVGAAAERGRMLPALIFVFVWLNVVYTCIAFWTWHPNGWYARMGGLDFGGGTPVHISSGCAALAYSYMLGKRLGYGTAALDRPHNATYVGLGTALLWAGWLGANAGSAHAANLRAVMAMVVTHVAACAGGVAWCLVACFRERTWSMVGFCCGVVSGLVAISPGAGYVSPWAAVVFGAVGGAACELATRLKTVLRCDEPLDIFAVHAVGGLVGNVLTALFATDSVARLDGVTHIAGGWIEQHWIQLAYQLAGSIAGGVYSFCGSCVILALITLVAKWWPALELRVSQEEERMGLDMYNGEVAVGSGCACVREGDEGLTHRQYLLDEPEEAPCGVVSLSSPSRSEALTCVTDSAVHDDKASSDVSCSVACIERKEVAA